MSQQCFSRRCTNPACYASKAKPAFCAACIDNILVTGGLVGVEPFTGLRQWRLTTCRTCGVQAHYRLDYILQRNAAGERVCRACFWRKWATDQRNRPWNAPNRRMLELLERHSPEQIRAALPGQDVEEFLSSGWVPKDRVVDLPSRVLSLPTES